MNPMRSTAVFTGIMLTLLALSAPAARAGALFGRPWTLSLRPTRGMTDEARLQLASTNVQAYVERGRVDGPLARSLRDARLMELGEAIAVISSLEKDRGGLHHRLALISLLSWRPADPEIRRAIASLVGSATAAAIYANLPSAPDHNPGPCQDADWEEEQLAVNDALNRSLGLLVKDQCDPVEAMLASTYDVGGGATGIVAKVIATAPLDTAQKGMDPQSWRRCSTLWEDSFMVKLDANGHVEDNGSCFSPTDPACLPNRGATRPYDASYDTDDPPKRPLFERFVCDGGWCDVRLLLRIITKVDAAALPPDPAYSMEYREPAKWRGFDFPVVDEGDVKIAAESSPGPKRRLTVLSNKVFAFDHQGTNAAVAFALKRLQMARYLADLVCCNP